MSSLESVSDTFDPSRWRPVPGFSFSDITYHRGISRGESDGASAGASLPWVRIAFNRPEVRNAFRPQTVDELLVAFEDARTDASVAAVILTGNGPSPKDGGYAFSSGGDQRVRGRDGYKYSVQVPAKSGRAETGDVAPDVEDGDLDAGQRARAGRLHILEVQRQIRTMPKVVIAAINGWAAGGGHSLGVVCDLAVASRQHAQFKQTDADVGSFDAGYGSTLLARQVGDRRAREIFFLARTYSAEQAERWGAINEAVDHDVLEETAIEYARLVAGKSPQALRMLKYAFNLADDGLAGQQLFAGEATRLAYMTDEAREGRDSFLERRAPNWSAFPYYF